MNESNENKSELDKYLNLILDVLKGMYTDVSVGKDEKGFNFFYTSWDDMRCCVIVPHLELLSYSMKDEMPPQLKKLVAKKETYSASEFWVDEVIDAIPVDVIRQDMEYYFSTKFRQSLDIGYCEGLEPKEYVQKYITK